MGIGFGVRCRDVVGWPPRVAADEFDCLSPVLGLQSQFGALLTEPQCAGMGRFGLISDNQGLGPIAAIDRLAKQSSKAKKFGFLVLCQGTVGLLCLILSAGQSSGLGHQQQSLWRLTKKMASTVGLLASRTLLPRRQGDEDPGDSRFS